ncbi:MAG TPA: GNAT family N-acetyltransferase [Myxococcota bacterium]|nr:GNAT family N-acetyltransferase [Myxococcota bacterium]
MQPTTTTERIDAHWSQFLGVPPSALRDAGVRVTAHERLGDYRGVWFFVRGRSAVVSAPAGWVARLSRHCASAAAEELLSRSYVTRALEPSAGTIVGPSFQGWLPHDRFQPLSADDVRPLSDSGADSIRAVQSSCSQEEWEHGGIESAGAEIWAAFEGARVVALGQLRVHFDGAVDPCVITHPQHRGRGHASRVVSALAKQALSARQLVLYQTLLSNAPAIAIALRLGFEPYATLLAVRLAPDSDEPPPPSTFRRSE